MHTRLFALIFSAVTALPVAAQAPWPSKPVRIVVPYAPGGITDTVTRLLPWQCSRASAIRR